MPRKEAATNALAPERQNPHKPPAIQPSSHPGRIGEVLQGPCSHVTRYSSQPQSRHRNRSPLRVGQLGRVCHGTWTRSKSCFAAAFAEPRESALLCLCLFSPSPPTVRRRRNSSPQPRPARSPDAARTTRSPSTARVTHDMLSGAGPLAQGQARPRKFTIQSQFGRARQPRSRKNRPCDACRRRKTACVIPSEPPCK